MRPGDLLGSRIPQIDIRDSASGDASPAGRLLVNYSTSSCDAAMDRVSRMRYGSLSFFIGVYFQDTMKIIISVLSRYCRASQVVGTRRISNNYLYKNR